MLREGTWAPALAGALVIFRSAVFVFYEQAHFDSDQAIVGLMALDVWQLDAFPLFFYGQRYLLGVESWIAAPFLGLGGVSVTALKLPLLGVNIIVAAALVRMLTRECRIRPLEALAASSFFILAPPIPASRLVEATGANIEPFAYVLLLWALRRRPWLFGLVLGFGCLNREFTIYAAGALVIIAVLERRLLARATVHFAARALIAGALVLGVVRLLIPFASNYFDGVIRPTPSFGDLPETADRAAAAGRVLGALLGVPSYPLATFNITSELTSGHGWLAVVLVVLLLVTSAGIVRQRPRFTSRFPLYLLLVGLQAIGVHALVAIGDLMLIRYSLLAVLIPVGLVSMFAAARPHLTARMVVAACIALWTTASVWDHVRLIGEYQRHRPRNAYRELALYLEGSGVRSGHAPYWTAYHITFLTGRRVVLSTPELVRIPELEQVVSEDGGAVTIRDEPCGGGRHIGRWYVCESR